MKNEKLEGIVDNILEIIPNIHKTLLTSSSGYSCNNPSSSQYKILGVLTILGDLPISEIGNKLNLSKPNMTVLIDRLIEEGMVKRIPQVDDRRIIKISITEKGKIHLKEIKKGIKEKIKNDLKFLNQKDIEVLYSSLVNINKVISKIKK